jgi:hypothetical protein
MFWILWDSLLGEFVTQTQAPLKFWNVGAHVLQGSYVYELGPRMYRNTSVCAHDKWEHMTCSSSMEKIWANYVAHERPLRAARNGCGGSLGHAMLKTFASSSVLDSRKSRAVESIVWVTWTFCLCFKISFNWQRVLYFIQVVHFFGLNSFWMTYRITVNFLELWRHPPAKMFAHIYIRVFDTVILCTFLIHGTYMWR